LTTTVNGVTILTLPGIGLAIILLIIFFFINYFGIKVLGKTNTGITIWKLIVPTITFILLFLAFNTKNFTSYSFFSNSGNYTGTIAMLYAIPSTGIVYAYLGFRQPVEYAGEAKNPQRDVARAIVLSLLIAIAIYTFLQISFIGAIDWSGINVTPGNWTALLSSPLANGPFYYELNDAGRALGLSLLTYWSYVLLIDAVISPSGTGLVYIGTTTRTFYGIATDEYFPQIFLRLNKYRIPIWSLAATLVASIVFLLPFPSWYEFVGFSSLATVFTYVMGGIGLQTLRKTAPDLRRPVRIFGGSIIAPIATISAILVVYWSGFTTIFFVLTSLFILVPIFWMYYAIKKLNMNLVVGIGVGLFQLIANVGLAYFAYLNILNDTSSIIPSFILYFLGFLGMVIIPSVVGYFMVNNEGKRYVLSGLWLLGLILSIYLLSFFGNFGPLSNPLIPFPYDTIIAIAIGLVFHYFAVKSGFRTEEIKSIIKEQLEQD
ncbi:amino acid permease, partial [Sulfolobus sp. A20-N-G8]